MDFEKLTQAELVDFLNGYPDIITDSNQPLSEQARQLFEILLGQGQAIQEYPEPIIDLYEAYLVQSKVGSTPKYTYQQILRLSDQDYRDIAVISSY